jgi:glycosyltransferase involved in cell wall biosynthesis
MKKYFSIILSVYNGTNEDFLSDALQSINTSVKFSRIDPDLLEVIIGVDGPIKAEVNSILIDYERSCAHAVRIIYFATNRGLGPVLADLVDSAHGTYCVRMDDDDIMVKERLSIIYEYHVKKGVELLSSDIVEFSVTPKLVTGTRRCANSLTNFSRFVRNPINHVATSFETQKIKDVGNYCKVPYFEDWHLWLRCAHLSYAKINLPLVNVRVNDKTIIRRTGLRYVSSEIGFLRALRPISIFGASIFSLVLPLRVVARFLPRSVYLIVMQRILRRK